MDLFVTLLFLPLLSSAPAPNTAFDAWYRDDFIRVGLKKEVRVAELYAKGTLLVLDGNKVVDRIKPSGRFFIVGNSASAQAGGPLWVQIGAGSPKNLKIIEKRMATRHPHLSFTTMRLSARLHTLRIGPIQDRSEAEQIRKLMVKEGIGDAFIPRNQAKYPFSWVDANFDKHVLRAGNLGLVRATPDNAIRFKGNGYRGILRFRGVGSRIRVINVLPMETYLRGVVPTELGPNSFPELEAIKAQAVAARTYALRNLNRFRKKGYDICDTQACQAYEGTTNEVAMSDQAVRETEGIVIYYGDEMIDALYTSTCGGTTDDVENVFPGRKEPYLRAKTSYVANYPSFSLPEHKIDRKKFASVSEDLAVRLLLYGFKKLPDLSGELSPAGFGELLTQFSWILGKPPKLPTGKTLSYLDFWMTLADLDVLQEAVAHQIEDSDIQILLRNYEIAEDQSRFAALLVRYDLVNSELLATFSSDQPVNKAWAHELLLGFCEILGPEPDWVRYRIEDVADGKLELSKGKKRRKLNLSAITHYVTEIGGRLEFVEKPSLEEWDRVYTLGSPFPSSLIKVKESGVVASVDRFSAFDTWIEKKSAGVLNARARKYVRGIGAIKGVKVLERAETGRVTLLEFDTDKGKKTVTGLRIRRSLGVKDNLFDLVPSYKNGHLVHLTILGRGWGHGVGMSQVGAFGLARMGWTFDKILTYYYTDVEVRPYEAP